MIIMSIFIEHSLKEILRMTELNQIHRPKTLPRFTVHAIGFSYSLVTNCTQYKASCKSRKICNSIDFLFHVLSFTGEVKTKSKFNSLDRMTKKKSRKGNKNPPSLVVVDTEESQNTQNTNTLTLSRKEKEKKKKRVGILIFARISMFC